MRALEPSGPVDECDRLGGKAIAFALAFYAASLAIATYPRVLAIRTGLPSPVDPLAHLTVLRWYRTCLLEGRSPLLLTGIQHPFGAPLGHFTPVHLQVLIYLPLSFLTSNDVLIYNILWFLTFLLAGIGTFVLAWQVLRDRPCALVAGLLAMLGGPLMAHALGHLELMAIGLFPIFLAAWIPFVDRPGWKAFYRAVGLYLLMAMGAAYFAILPVVPAVLYVVLGAARRVDLDRHRARMLWLTGFGAAVLPGLCLLLGGQLVDAAHGDGVNRPLSEFARYGAPAWSYLVPTALHPLGRLLETDPYAEAGAAVAECSSYLGLVTLGLIAWAAVGRVKFRNRGFWWATGLILVLLSLGAYATIGGRRIGLPGLWLWEHLAIVRAIRVPARFNLLVGVVAAIVAAAGLRDILSRIGPRGARVAILGSLVAVAIADLGIAPFPSVAVPPMPASYEMLARRDPAMTLMEVPLEISGNAHLSNALTGYWQAFHGGQTTGGYSSFTNAAFDHQLVINSPFSAPALAEPDYLLHPESASFGIVRDVAFRDYAWLTLHVNDLRYIVLHDWPDMAPAGRGRLQAELADTLLFEERSIAVYDRERLAPPARPTLLITRGWRGGWHGRDRLVLGREGGLAVYSPASDRDLTFSLHASAFRRTRTVRLLDGEAELARWRIEPGEAAWSVSPPFRLPGGIHQLTIASDGDERPIHRHETATQGDWNPYSLIVRGVRLNWDEEDESNPVMAGQPGPASGGPSHSSGVSRKGGSRVAGVHD